MAKLPPKIPSIVSQSHDPDQHNQWPDLSRNDCLEIQPHPNTQQSWVDEFMEFSAAKRTSHRRSVSESSVAFIESGPGPVKVLGPVRGMDETGNGVISKGDQFDKFNDEEFMSMFSNDIGGSSSTSDHNSTNESQKRKGDVGVCEGDDRMNDGEDGIRAETTIMKNEAEEVESFCKVNKDGQQERGWVGIKDGSNLGGEIGNDNDGDKTDQQQSIDPKRFKRILANRQSAQRSRVRKLQYISELERSVTVLQSEVSILSPRVAFLDHQRLILNVDNNTIKAKIAVLAQDKIFKDSHQEALKREIERLRQVYYQQSLNQTAPQQPDTIASENE